MTLCATCGTPCDEAGDFLCTCVHDRRRREAEPTELESVVVDAARGLAARDRRDARSMRTEMTRAARSRRRAERSH